MLLDINNLNRHIARGTLRQGSWGDGYEQACLMSALVSEAKSESDCAAQGWPLWLAELSVWLFDRFDDDYVDRGRALAEAIAKSDQDWDRVWTDVRLNAILPIAMRSIGDGDEPWRAECRRVVQWSIDNGGAPARAAEAAEAAGAAGAARAVKAARAAGAAARDEICAALMASLKQAE